MQFDRLTFEMRRLALAAGARIMEIYEGPDFAVRAKSDASPVTEADEAADALIAESLRAAFPGKKWIFLLSIMADKDVEAMLDILCPLAAQAVTVAAASPRALPAGVLAEKLRARGVAAESETGVEAGLARVLALADAQNAPAAVLGTLYFSGDVRRAFTKLTGTAR